VVGELGTRTGTGISPRISADGGGYFLTVGNKAPQSDTLSLLYKEKFNGNSKGQSPGEKDRKPAPDQAAAKRVSGGSPNSEGLE